ncbi:hypothetical protein NDU88_002730 [Pleurodeles waltl]|uniref:Uncharacterized protein n=1 Tax=Pleurodeles waltl TaxID=8319 RepID=A0AAV7SE11_PLEWA|nr:hypothetical protein NDU88_002730 [Pleurodeles waltl]
MHTGTVYILERAQETTLNNTPEGGRDGDAQAANNLTEQLQQGAGMRGLPHRVSPRPRALTKGSQRRLVVVSVNQGRRQWLLPQHHNSSESENAEQAATPHQPPKLPISSTKTQTTEQFQQPSGLLTVKVPEQQYRSTSRASGRSQQ